jgi:hypothetical protein
LTTNETIITPYSSTMNAKKDELAAITDWSEGGTVDHVEIVEIVEIIVTVNAATHTIAAIIGRI